MAEIARLSGAILVRSEGKYFLIGDLKEPCDFMANGFMDPGELKPAENSFISLLVSGKPAMEPVLVISKKEGEDLCWMLAKRLLIKRNGSVSNRLWNLILDAEENEGPAIIRADWLIEMPEKIWEVVRDGVLRCS